MLKWLIKYWPEILIFGAIFGLLLMVVSPKLTFMMVDSDGASYLLAAKYFYPAHGTGEPLYVLLGYLFLLIPLGTDYWRMSLLSTVATIGGMVFIYLAVRQLLADNKKERLFAVIASVIYGSAMLVIAQSGIVETYALVTMLSMGAFYFMLKKNWLMVSVMLGLGLAVHHLILITWIVLFVAHKELRHWKWALVTLAFLGFYLYLPISKHLVGAPDHWVNTSVGSFFYTNISAAYSLIGGLSIWDFPARVFNALGIVGVSLGMAVIPLIWWLWKAKRWKSELLWLFLLPIIYYATDSAQDVAKYMEASIGFGAIIAVLGLSRLNIRWSYAVAVVAVGLLAFNINYLDIGRTLDPNLSAQKFYDEELPKIPDGQIFMTNTSWEWQMTLLYNKEEDRRITPVCIATLSGEPYLAQLEDMGVNLERNDSKSMNERQALIAKSILRLNENVWMDLPTDSATYGGMVFKGDNGEADALIAHTIANPNWNFKPSNPYDMVTGAIQVKEWKFFTLSNYNMRFFIGLASMGLILNWFIFVLPAKRKVTDEKKGEQ